MNLLEQRAYRCLKYLEPYYDLTAPDVVLPAWVLAAGIEEGEYLVGVYIPVPDEPTEAIIVGSRGLHIERDSAWIFLAYGRLDSIRIPEEFSGEGKFRMNRLTVTMTDGRVIEIPIRKHHWKFSDVPGIARFLIDVRDDVRDGKISIE